MQGSNELEDNVAAKVMKQYKALGQSARSLSPVVDSAEDEKLQLRNFCPIWRFEADLPDTAKVLYKRAAELAGISLTTLIRGATQVERQIELWCMQKTMGRGKSKGKGKAIVQLGGDSDNDM